MLQRVRFLLRCTLCQIPAGESCSLPVLESTECVTLCHPVSRCNLFRERYRVDISSGIRYSTREPTGVVLPLPENGARVFGVGWYNPCRFTVQYSRRCDSVQHGEQVSAWSTASMLPSCSHRENSCNHAAIRETARYIVRGARFPVGVLGVTCCQRSVC